MCDTDNILSETYWKVLLQNKANKKFLFNAAVGKKKKKSTAKSTGRTAEAVLSEVGPGVAMRLFKKNESLDETCAIYRGMSRSEWDAVNVWNLSRRKVLFDGMRYRKDLKKLIQSHPMLCVNWGVNSPEQVFKHKTKLALPVGSPKEVEDLSKNAHFAGSPTIAYDYAKIYKGYAVKFTLRKGARDVLFSPYVLALPDEQRNIFKCIREYTALSSQYDKDSFLVCTKSEGALSGYLGIKCEDKSYSLCACNAASKILLGIFVDKVEKLSLKGK